MCLRKYAVVLAPAPYLACIFLLISLSLFSVPAVAADKYKIFFEVNRLIYELRISVLSTIKFSVEASSAKVEGFQLLKLYKKQLSSDFATLKQGSPQGNPPPLPHELIPNMQKIEHQIKQFNQGVDLILKAEGSIRILKEFLRAADEMTPEIFKLCDEIAAHMVKNGASPRQVYVASGQMALMLRMERSVNNMLDKGKSVERFKKDYRLFSSILDAMSLGNEKLDIQKVQDKKIRAMIHKCRKLVSLFSELVDKIIERKSDYDIAQAAVQDLFIVSDSLSVSISDLFEKYRILLNIEYKLSI